MDPTLTRLLLLGAIAAILLAPLAWRIARRRFDVFEPLVLFVVAYGVMFVIRPVSMVARDDLVFQGPRGPLDVSDTFSRMLFVALIGALAFITGYELSVGRRLARRLRGLRNLDSRRIVVGALIFAGIALSSQIFFLASHSGLSTLGLLFRGTTSDLEDAIAETSFYVWSAFLFLIPSALILFAVGLERRSKLILLAASFLALVFLIRTVPLGERSALFPLLGGLFVLLYLRRSSRPSLVTLLAIAAIALVGSAFLSDLRGRATRNETVSETVVRAATPSRFLSPFFSGPDSEMAPALAAALEAIPSELPYTYGATIGGDLLTRPVPRALWPEKPTLPRIKLTDHIWPAESAKGGINPEFSVLLYFYWDFGIPGVLIGLSLFGIAARLLFEYFVRHGSDLSVQVLYSLSLPFLVTGMRNGPVDTVILAVFVVLPALLIFLLAGRRAIALPATPSR